MQQGNTFIKFYGKKVIDLPSVLNRKLALLFDTLLIVVFIWEVVTQVMSF